MLFRDRKALRSIAGIYPDIARHTEHGKLVSLPLGKPLWPIVMQVEDVGKSEGCIVTMQIQANVWHESELTFDWSSVAR